MRKYCEALLFCSFLTCFLGCKSKVEAEGIETLAVDISTAVTQDLRDRVDVMNVVALETTDASLIGGIRKLHIGKDYILAVSFSGERRALLFDKNGKFVRRIGRNGRGPGEIHKMTEVQFDEHDKAVYIYDRARQCMMTFDLNGTLLSEKFNNIWIDSFCKTRDGFWAYIPNNTAYDGYALVLLDDDFKTVKEEFFYHKKFFPTTFMPRFFENDEGEFFFSYPFDNVIYRLADGKAQPYCQIDFGVNTLPYSEIRNIERNAAYDALIDNGNFVGESENLVFCGERLFFDFRQVIPAGRKIMTYRAMYDLTARQGELYNNSTVIFSMPEQAKYPFKRVSFDKPLAASGGLWVYAVQPFSLHEDDLAMVKEKVLPDIAEDSNALLLFVRLKDKN